MNKFLKNNPFVVVESEATDENPFAENKIRLATPEEFGKKVLEHLQDEDFVNMLKDFKNNKEE